MNHDPIGDYLAELRRELGRFAWRRRQTLAEVEDHLREAAGRAEHSGVCAGDAARQAVEQFGSPQVVARQSTVAAWGNRRLVAVAVAVGGAVGVVAAAAVMHPWSGSSQASATSVPSITYGHSHRAEISGTDVTIPRVTPMYVKDAENTIRSAGLGVELASVPAITGADAGTNGYAIQGQFPAAGTHVRSGTVVFLRLAISVNGGPGGVGKPGTVPNLVGMSINNAIAAATHVGLHVTVPAVNHAVASDSVTAQSIPAGSRVKLDSVITLAVG